MGRVVIETPVALGMALTFIVAWGMAHGWNATFGPIFRRLGNLGITAGRGFFRIDVHPFRFLLDADRAVQHFFSQAMALAEKRLVQALWAIVEPFILIAGVTLALGLTGYEGLQALWHHVTHTAPGVIYKTIVRPLDRVTRHTIGALQANVSHLTHRVDFLAHRIEHATAVASHAVAAPAYTLDRLLRDRARTRQRLHEIEKKLTYPVLAGLVTAVLAREGFKLFKCDGWKAAARRVTCGMGSALAELLGTTFEALIVLDLCRFALAAQSLARFVVPQLGAVLLVPQAVCLGGGASLPSAHDAPKTLTKITPPSAHD